ncbi:glycosyltransferase family 2 protein [Pelagibacteraceae bacterium]|jgi:glycosyltransferase involved in cell wall biosynthesis|nr:glycosyltransferase family 2 protein [Pelagibacteraceae bacterium]
MSINFSLVLPCYNEEENISLLYKEFSQINLDQFQSELIFVNNGSADNTKNEIERIIRENKKVNINIVTINLEENQGYGGGIAEGLKISKGEFIGWAHADLQTPLEDFFKLFKLVKDKKEIFGKGFRTNNRGLDGIVSRFHESLASLILGYKMVEINAQPKIFSKDLMKYFSDIPYKWTVLDTYVNYICLKNKIKIETINVIFKKRIHGKSKWKNNLLIFLKHIVFNVLYLFKLRFKFMNDSRK